MSMRVAFWHKPWNAASTSSLHQKDSMILKMFFTTLLDSLWTHRKRDLLQLGCLLTMCSAERSQFHSKYKKSTDRQPGAFNVFKDTKHNFLANSMHSNRAWRWRSLYLQQLVDRHIAPSSVEVWSHSAVTSNYGDSALPSGRKHDCRILADSWLMPGIESVDGMPDWVISENGDVGNNLPVDRKGEKVI